MDEERMNHHRQRILRENARFVNTNTPSENKPYSNNKNIQIKRLLDANIVIRLDRLILNILTKKEKDPFNV